MERPLVALALLLLLSLTVGVETVRRIPGPGNCVAAPCKCRSGNTQVNCRGLQLRAIPRLLPPEVRMLDMGLNALTRLEERDGLHKYKHLMELRVENNSISIIGRKAFPPSLRVVNLSANNLVEIKPRMFANVPLRKLLVSNNRLQKIAPGSLPPTLQYLHLDGNRLSRIHRSVFDHCQALKLLDLASNQIKHIEPRALPTGLRMLQLGYNKLKHVGREFSHLSRLASLHLFFNDIRHLDVDAFSHLSELRELYLLGNKLTVIQPQLFANQKRLAILQLQKNHISTFHEEALPLGHFIKQIYLQRNPLVCNCRMKWFADYEREQKKRAEYSDNSYYDYKRFLFDAGIEQERWPSLPDKEDIFCSGPDLFRQDPLLKLNLDFCERMTYEEFELLGLPGPRNDSVLCEIGVGGLKCPEQWTLPTVGDLEPTTSTPGRAGPNTGLQGTAAPGGAVQSVACSQFLVLLSTLLTSLAILGTL